MTFYQPQSSTSECQYYKDYELHKYTICYLSFLHPFWQTDQINKISRSLNMALSASDQEPLGRLQSVLGTQTVVAHCDYTQVLQTILYCTVQYNVQYIYPVAGSIVSVLQRAVAVFSVQCSLFSVECAVFSVEC